MCTLLCPKYKNAIWDRTPLLNIKPSLCKCMAVQRSQIFKLNWIILILSRIIAILVIWDPTSSGGWHRCVCAGVWGMWGVPTCMHAHAYMLNRNWKWPTCLSWLTLCVCAHAWVPPTHIHPNPAPDPDPGGQITKNAISLEQIKIIQFCLKICKLWRLPTYGWVCISWWVIGWMSGVMSNH